MNSERKSPDQTWESFTESRIREAMEAGAFRNLPGFGKPIADIDEPWDDNSWVRKKLRDEKIVALPPILEARLRIDRFLSDLESLPTETEVRRQVETLNDFVRQAHYSHLPGPADGVRPLDVDATVAEWKRRRA